jgi:hypothetical protein
VVRLWLGISLGALMTFGCSGPAADAAPTLVSGEAADNQVLDAELQIPVELAAARWGAATCVDVRVDGGGVVWSLADEIVDADGRAYAGLTGPDVANPAWVLVKTAKLDKARVALHEMGHRLGGLHVDDTVGIMAERSYVGGGYIDEASLNGVCAVRECGCFAPESAPQG